MWHNFGSALSSALIWCHEFTRILPEMPDSARVRVGVAGKNFSVLAFISSVFIKVIAIFDVEILDFHILLHPKFYLEYAEGLKALIAYSRSLFPSGLVHVCKVLSVSIWTISSIQFGLFETWRFISANTRKKACFWLLSSSDFLNFLVYN